MLQEALCKLGNLLTVKHFKATTSNMFSSSSIVRDAEIYLVLNGQCSVSLYAFINVADTPDISIMPVLLCVLAVLLLMLPANKISPTRAADRDKSSRHRREAVEVWSSGRVGRVLMLRRDDGQ